MFPNAAMSLARVLLVVPALVGSTVPDTSCLAEGRDWEAWAGLGNRVCRGHTVDESDPLDYNVTSAATLEECKAKCLEDPCTCKGVEYNSVSGRCEVWHREAGISAWREPEVQGFTCQRFGWPAKFLIPLDGGAGRACRGDTETDNDDRYYRVEDVMHMEDCRARCVTAVDCKGIEFSGNRCEIWTRPILATKALTNFTCLRYEGPGSSFYVTTVAPLLP
mmetsp:Transcript_109754/g.153789  ORF Transcript_109754/g.153789 Transcript_109754/m.153789 type:complete len:220 (-) Transcript_109754:194-853(-)|eukprot:s1845_g3.t1